MSDLRPVGFETNYTDFGEGYVKDGIKTTEWEAPNGSIWHDPSDYHLARELGEFDFDPEAYEGDLDDLSEEELEAYYEYHPKTGTQEGHSLLLFSDESTRALWETSSQKQRVL